LVVLLSGLVLTACSSPAEKASQRELESLKLAAPFTIVKSGFEQHSAYRQYVVPKDRFTPAAVLVPRSYRRVDAPLVSGLKESQRQMVRSGTLVLARITSQCGPW
jgi:hypothetical protein